MVGPFFSLNSNNPRRFETQISRLAFAGTRSSGIVQAADFQDFLTRLAAATHTFNLHAAGVSRRAGQRIPGLQVNEHEAAPALVHLLELTDLKGQDAATGGGAGDMGGGFQRRCTAASRYVRRLAHSLAFGATDESLASLQARAHALNSGQEAITTAAAEQQGGAGRAGKIVRQLRS